MEWVMVPVPEEHVEEVRRFMLGLWTRENVTPWDQAAMADFVRDAEEDARSLLVVVANHTVKADAPTVRAVADSFGCSVREALQIVSELNDAARATGRLALVKVETKDEASGERRLNMPKLWARLVENAVDPARTDA
jgi:hypothetical protein